MPSRACHKKESDGMKRYALLMSLVLCGIALAFEGKVNVAEAL